MAGVDNDNDGCSAATGGAASIDNDCDGRPVASGGVANITAF